MKNRPTTPIEVLKAIIAVQGDCNKLCDDLAEPNSDICKICPIANYSKVTTGRAMSCLETVRLYPLSMTSVPQDDNTCQWLFGHERFLAVAKEMLYRIELDMMLSGNQDGDKR